MRQEVCEICKEQLTLKEIGWSDIGGGTMRCYKHRIIQPRRIWTSPLIHSSKYAAAQIEVPDIPGIFTPNSNPKRMSKKAWKRFKSGRINGRKIVLH